MALKIGYMTVTGSIYGEVEGPSTYKLAKKSIEVVDIEHMVSRDYDSEHGTISGDSHHEPLTVYKPVDCSSPILYRMCCIAERVAVKLQYYIEVGDADNPVEFYSWTLENAYVGKVRQIPARELGGDYAQKYDLLEAVSFPYQRIIWEHYAHPAPIGVDPRPNTVMEYSWQE